MDEVPDPGEKVRVMAVPAPAAVEERSVGVGEVGEAWEGAAEGVERVERLQEVGPLVSGHLVVAFAGHAFSFCGWGLDWWGRRL